MSQDFMCYNTTIKKFSGHLFIEHFLESYVYRYSLLGTCKIDRLSKKFDENNIVDHERLDKHIMVKT